MNLRERILSASDLKKSTVNVPEWNNGEDLILTVRELSAAEREEVLNLHVQLAGASVVTPAICETIRVATLDENGEQLFQPEDVSALAGKHEDPLMRIYRAIMELSGITSEAENNAEPAPGKHSENAPSSGVITG